jgi:hypothetical protein
MFVPRALRLKGVKEANKTSKPAAENRSKPAGDDDVVTAAIQKGSVRGPKFAPVDVSPEYMAQLAAGIELIFTDYAYQHAESAEWLQKFYRTVDGEDRCKLLILNMPALHVLTMTLDIHLSAILGHTNIVDLKPKATQPLLREAIQEHGSSNLQLSENGSYIRRRPSTYPLAFIPQNATTVVDDEGLSFWDQRTIYVEPHIRHLCRTPAKVAHWLQEKGQIKAKWLPIQAVEHIFDTCGFVVLSGSVMQEDVWKKWRAAEKPEDWKIMTKVEHTKRTKEYLDLLRSSRTDKKRKRDADTISGRDINDVEDAARHTKSTDEDWDVLESSRAEKKRKRAANTVSGLNYGDVEKAAEDGSHPPSAKKHKKQKKTKHKSANDIQEAYGVDIAGGTVSEAEHETESTV